jgi:general secretion pathway protein G
MKSFFKNHSAFTLIEIIIALAIVGIFITVPVLAYGNYAKTQRDLKRKADINQIQSALQQYKASTGKYPETPTWEQDLVNGGYMAKIPEDPSEGTEIPDEGGLT